MATRYSIEMDFNRAKNQANKLDEIANDLDNLSRVKFSGTLQDLSASWKGDNANAYLSKGSKLQGQMNTSASDLRSIASDIRTIAQRIYDAEMAALEIAEQRTY